MSDNNKPELTMSFNVKFERKELKREAIEIDKTQEKENGKPKKPKIPRVVQLLALAHHYNDLLKQGVVKDYADIARLGGVSRARITQIMGLLLLAPEIQIKMLIKHQTVNNLLLRDFLTVNKEVDWERQMDIWNSMVGGTNAQIYAH